MYQLTRQMWLDMYTDCDRCMSPTGGCWLHVSTCFYAVPLVEWSEFQYCTQERCSITSSEWRLNPVNRYIAAVLAVSFPTLPTFFSPALAGPALDLRGKFIFSCLFNSLPLCWNWQSSQSLVQNGMALFVMTAVCWELNRDTPPPNSFHIDRWKNLEVTFGPTLLRLELVS